MFLLILTGAALAGPPRDVRIPLDGGVTSLLCAQECAGDLACARACPGAEPVRRCKTKRVFPEAVCAVHTQLEPEPLPACALPTPWFLPEGGPVAESLAPFKPSGAAVPAAALRAAALGPAYAAWSGADRRKAAKGAVAVGAPAHSDFVAWGFPDAAWTGPGDGCFSRVYLAQSSVVHTCDGAVVGVATHDDPLSCDVHGNTVESALSESHYATFVALSPALQWRVLTHDLSKGDAEAWVRIALPDVLEDEVTHGTGRLWASDGGLRTWRVDFEDGVVVRIKDKLDRAAARAARREAKAARVEQSAGGFGQVLRLAGRTALMVGGMVLAEELQQQAGGGATLEHHESRSSGSNSLDLNGKRYTDVVGGAMGTSCSLQAPCPDGYACNITSTIGICVPAGQ